MNSATLEYVRILLNARLAKIDEHGASAVEYAMLIAGIVAAVVVVAFAFGNVLRAAFSHSCADVNDNVQGGTCS